MMKTFSIVLLVAALCVERASSLICYKCENAKSHQDCKAEVKCSDMEKHCVSSKAERTSNREVIINKWCSAMCPPGGELKGFGAVNITCCQTDYCNSGGPGSVKTSSVVLGLATLASFFCVLRTGL